MALDSTVHPMEAPREQALVARARGDARAFGTLYDEYLPRIYGFIARRVEDRSTAEQLTPGPEDGGPPQAVPPPSTKNSIGSWPKPADGD